MAGKFIVITGLDGSGTSSVAEELCKRDPEGELFKTLAARLVKLANCLMARFEHCLPPPTTCTTWRR